MLTAWPCDDLQAAEAVLPRKRRHDLERLTPERAGEDPYVHTDLLLSRAAALLVLPPVHRAINSSHPRAELPLRRVFSCRSQASVLRRVTPRPGAAARQLRVAG